MATLHHYECTNPKCKFSINTEPYGHYALMSGHYLLFRCPHCKEIKYLSADEITQRRYNLRCDDCCEILYSWNPVEGKCPECGSALAENTDEITMAD